MNEKIHKNHKCDVYVIIRTKMQIKNFTFLNSKFEILEFFFGKQTNLYLNL